MRVQIRTELDGIGCTRDGRPVVIELKTTGGTVAHHKAGYNNVCIKRPRLLTGQANSCYWRHQIQLGFGAMCTDSRSGLVVVSCSDGTVSYPLQIGMADDAKFRWPLIVGGGAGRVMTGVIESMVSWPTHDEPIIAAIARLSGLEGVKDWTVVASPPASARLEGGRAHERAVVSIVAGRLTIRKRRAATHAATGSPIRIMVSQCESGWTAELLT